jgi:hypothetical protein
MSNDLELFFRTVPLAGKAGKLERNVRAASFVGFVFTSFSADSTARVRFPASNCNLASFIGLVVRAGSAILF